MVWVLSGLLIVLTVSFGVIIVRLIHHAENGWAKALEIEREHRNYSASRIVSLENRLMAKNWVEYGNLQSVPDEVTEAAWANRQPSGPTLEPMMYEGYGASAQDMAESQAVSSGADLEGSTIG